MTGLYAAIILVGCVLGWYGYRLAYKKGSNDLFQVFLKSGYDTRVNGFKTLNPLATKHQVVIIGDSITQNYLTDELFKAHTGYTRGIGGDTTSGVLNRLEESCFALDPAHVFLWIGTNDFAIYDRSPEAIATNIEAIVTQIKATLTDVKISIVSVCPVNATIDPISVGSRRNDAIQTLNQMISVIPQTDYVHLYEALTDASGRLNPLYTYDGLHLNNDAYQFVTDIFQQAIS